MRPPVDRERLHAFAEQLGRTATSPTIVYLTGGATAVLEGWRASTVDIDPYSQALSKIERGFTQDLKDVQDMLDSGLVEPSRLRELYEQMEPQLYRYPAIDSDVFRRKLDSVLDSDYAG